MKPETIAKIKAIIESYFPISILESNDKYISYFTTAERKFGDLTNLAYDLSMLSQNGDEPFSIVFKQEERNNNLVLTIKIRFVKGESNE